MNKKHCEPEQQKTTESTSNDNRVSRSADAARAGRHPGMRRQSAGSWERRGKPAAVGRRAKKSFLTKTIRVHFKLARFGISCRFFAKVSIRLGGKASRKYDR
jgi:hypothetical protein